jgi:hypothetical protein
MTDRPEKIERKERKMENVLGTKKDLIKIRSYILMCFGLAHRQAARKFGSRALPTSHV